MSEPHCATCICGRRAPVQGDGFESVAGFTRRRPIGAPGVSPGTVSWEEHLVAWTEYARRYPGQSAERIAERGGFGYLEMTDYLGHEPKTWRAR